ncbi:MAG: UvrD-helicase domain-containing protein [Candidatus Marinimicrobia bacterium]|nr:UvrD-helicase domain-containing protein [Candidatus Neomarinimicrobiota bacterium]
MSIDLNKVFDLNRNVLIEACAGAGKTWLLSKRYAAIMDDFARQHAENPQVRLDASNILVLTFTRKAAAEMSGRIYADLNQLLNDQVLENVPANFGQHLRISDQSYKMHLRSTYSRNAISTIDSFCTQILRDQAERLDDIDPEFRIQDEADTQRMELETWENFLRERSRNQDKDLKILLDHLSEFHLTQYVKKFLSHAQLMMDWLVDRKSHSPGELVERFKQEHPLPVSLQRINDLLLDLVASLPEAEAILKPDSSQYTRLIDLRAFLNESPEDVYLYELNLIHHVRQIGLKSTGTEYHTKPQVHGTVWPKEWLPEIKSRLQTFLDELPELIPFETLMNDIPSIWDLEACTVHHHLAKFFLDYWDVLNQRLKREGVLSFNEVILQTHQLLQNPAVAAHYGQRFQHILIDEFQDTNDIRWDIVRLIAQNKQAVLRDRGLFIVGDTKQSIYRFNQADVQVMNRVRRMIDSSGGSILNADETFRSSSKYVKTVINPLSSVAFPSAEEKDGLELFETHFNPTAVSKDSPLTEAQHQLARCELSAVLEGGDSRGMKADIYHTADLAQNWLTWMDQNAVPAGDGPSVGILLRSFSHILDYIRIFTAKGLDFEVLSSKGLFQQQESYDIYHLLSVLINPLDDLALVGVLRSPFFVLTDAEIQELRESAEDNTNPGWVWFNLLKLRNGLAKEIQSWQTESARQPVDRLITHIVSNNERQLGWISETGGNLRLANLNRLIHLIHQLSLDGLGLREIHEYFKFQIQHGDAPQAELPGTTRIQILSIHKSKGLEFPVVILPNLQAPEKNETSGIFLGQGDDGHWEAGISLDTLKTSPKTWLYERIKTRTKAEELAEDKRLFYVAISRARYGVSFVARINPATKPGSNTWWKRYLQPVFDLELDKDAIQSDPRSVQTEWVNRSTPEMVYNFILGSDLLQNESVRPPEADINIQPLPELAPAYLYEEISPHTIMKWMDPKSYPQSDEKKIGEDHGEDTRPRKFGTLLHRVMEMSWFDQEQHAEDIRLFLEGLDISDTSVQQVFLSDLSDCLSIYRGSDLAEKLAGLTESNKLAELPVFGYLQSKTRVYKVSGIIDLLYYDGNEWIVQDYKSDKELPPDPEENDYPYWYQIQTYLWMLKLLYGIEARGELYFNRFDQLISIDYDEDLYFSRLGKTEQGRGLRPLLPSNTELDPGIQGILKRIDPELSVILIEPTKNSGERLVQALAQSGFNKPRIQVMTLNELRNLTLPEGRSLTPYLTRLAVADLLGRDLKWGVINRLGAAFYRASQGEVVIDSKQELYKKFILWCDQHKIILPGKSRELSGISSDTKIIIDSIHSTAPADYAFLARLAEQNETIFLNPLKEGSASAGFAMSIRDWADQDEMPDKQPRHSYTPCFSVYEEVVLSAHHIRNLLAKGVVPANILVAVSSMERYIPSIKRVFSDLGISVRLSKREPVMERPVTHLAFALIQGRLRRHLTWDMAMSVWLHPLVLPPGTEGNDRLRLDIEARKLGITLFDESLIDNLRSSSLKQAAKELLAFISEVWRSKQKGSLLEEIEWLSQILGSFQFTHRLEPGSVASKAYTSLKNALDGIRNDWDRYLKQKGSLSDLNRELRERLKGVEVASAQQGFGVDVISILDTLNLKNKHLLVMGLTEGQFPLAPDSNPYLVQSELNPWFLNLYLFKQWLRRPAGSLHLTAPLRNVDGASLELSTFCQYLIKNDYPKLPIVSRDQYLHYLAGKLIPEANSKYQVRHNAVLTDAGKGDWYGKLGPHDQRSFDQISASAFDELIKCPQRYWYSRMLRLEPAETDITERNEIEIGNLVHQVLEKFGKAGSFLLVGSDLNAALVQLETIALQHLKDKDVKPELDLLDSKWSELYFKNFSDPDQNLLAAMLQIEADALSSYGDIGLHEQAFGYSDDLESWPSIKISDESITLSLVGKIDRVLVSGEHVWASDYKTGKVDIKDSQDFWTSQMLFYFLVLKSRFPDKKVVLTYDQVRAFKENEVGLKGYLGDVESESPIMSTVRSKNQLLAIGDQGDWSIKRIQAETLACAQHLADNEFPLTSRDEDKACAYCHFERICRKTALPR